MRKIFSKWYVIVAIICIIGFGIGFSAEHLFTNEVKATNIEPLDWDAENVDCSYIFDKDVYSATYNEDKRTIRIYAKNDSKSRNVSGKEYTKDDAKELAELMIGKEYELRLIDQRDGGYIYEEYKDGHATGGLATYLFDTEGYLVEASFRAGSIYNFEEDKMITEVEAFEVAVAAIKEKYGESTEIFGTVDDYEITTYYVPKRDEICYWIDKVEGYVPGVKSAVIDTVYFYITVSPDGSFVEVASSLRY